MASCYLSVCFTCISASAAEAVHENCEGRLDKSYQQQRRSTSCRIMWHLSLPGATDTYILRDYPYLGVIALESIPQVLTVEEERKIHFPEKGIIAISNNRY
jgi:hypothetical protein